MKHNHLEVNVIKPIGIELDYEKIKGKVFGLLKERKWDKDFEFHVSEKPLTATAFETHKRYISINMNHLIQEYAHDLVDGITNNDSLKISEASEILFEGHLNDDSDSYSDRITIICLEEGKATTEKNVYTWIVKSAIQHDVRYSDCTETGVARAILRRMGMEQRAPQWRSIYGLYGNT